MGAGAAATTATGEGIIEGTEVKVGTTVNAAGESETEGELIGAPTDWKGNETYRELAGSTAFT